VTECDGLEEWSKKCNDNIKVVLTKNMAGCNLNSSSLTWSDMGKELDREQTKI